MTMRGRLLPLFLLLLSALGACDVATSAPRGPAIPNGSVQFTPGLRYKVWWSLVQSCSSRTADMNAVRFYQLPNVTELPDGAQGAYYPLTNQIVIVGDFVEFGPLVRHEMLHALLPVGGHPHDPFVTTCDGIVGCDGPCAVEAARQVPDSASPEIPVSAIFVDVSTFPATLSSSVDSGMYEIVITATNFRDTPVWATLNPSVGSGKSTVYQTWSYLLDTAPGQFVAGQGSGIGSARAAFGAQETLRSVWDATVDPSVRGLQGSFNTDSSPRRLVVYK